MRKVWIECALNGAWTRERQPAIPISRDEIIADGVAAAKAGAAIIHLHAYDETTGRQKDDYDLYAPLIEGIRAQCDAIVYPTLPITGSGYAGELRSARERYAHLEKLAQNGLAEWAVIDPGSAVFTRFDEIARGEPGYTYFNPDDHFYEGMRIGEQYAVRPSFAIYEAGCTRLGAAKAKQMPGVPVPVYRFMFADEFCFGFPPKAVLSRYASAIARRLRPGASWMVAGLGVDIRPLIAAGRRARRTYPRRSRGPAVGCDRNQRRIGGGGGEARACGGRRGGDAGRGAYGLRGHGHITQARKSARLKRNDLADRPAVSI